MTDEADLPPQVLKNLLVAATDDGEAAAPAGTLDKYRLGREIARGAMGVVYEAEDLELHRAVAVKVMNDAAGLSDVMRQRFQREARSAGGISHPNVVQLHDAGESGGKPYLVMELVDGQPLNVILAQRKYEVGAMLRLLEKAARGIAAAHAAGIVHRDVKPANILVTAAGEPKVGDFGLAHWVDSDSALTKTGAPLGTPMYMAPEQVRGGRGDVSPATDVYGLGAILYEILTGRPPHTGESTVEIYDRILNDEPVAPRRFGTRVPMDLQTVCLKALDKSPSRRYRDAKDFADDLRRHLDGEPVVARPAGVAIRIVRWARRHRGVAVALGIVLAVAATLLAADLRTRRLRADEIDTAFKRGLDGLAECATVLQRVEQLARRERDLAAAVRPEDEKAALWAAQKELNLAKLALQDTREEVIRRFAILLERAPRHAEGRTRLAAFHFDLYERAAEAGDVERMKAEASQVRIYDDAGVRVPKLAREGTLTIDSSPPGAEAELYRYVEGDDHRLAAEKDRALGRCPIGALRLEAGSYLVILKRDGCRDARYPVVIRHGQASAAKVQLHPDAVIGADFVQVPAGPFTKGGDPEAPDARPEEAVEVPEFFIGRTEVTFGAYAEFINDLIATDGIDAAQKRVMREPGGRYRWMIPAGSQGIRPEDPDHPLNGISAQDAEAFAAWKTLLARTAGEKVRYRLPTAAEWEKAARGADGRRFPWGNSFDLGFVIHPGGNTGRALNGPVGSHPKDESPYGVKDLGGGVSEICSDRDRTGTARAAKGGNYVIQWGDTYRSAGSTWMPETATLHSVGFRLVKVVEP